MRYLCATINILCLLFPVSGAVAHSVKCFACAEGDTISGYAWTVNGARCRDVPFKVLGPEGKILHQGKTGPDGEFSFVPSRICDHEVVVLAGEGHAARFIVSSNELAGNSAAGSCAERSGRGPPPVAHEDRNGAEFGRPTPTKEEIERIVARAVSTQVAPLRKELAEFAERRRVQDIIAGLGYIAGLTGIAFFLLGHGRGSSDS